MSPIIAQSFQFTQAFEGKLPVNEIYYSLQGEGRWVGTPAVIIRFQYCNIGCSWCDTRFAWDNIGIDEANLYPPERLALQARVVVPDEVFNLLPPHIVLTGGEPMLHQDRLPHLIVQLKRIGFSFFEIETNGVISPNTKLLDMISWWNCSPKLSNSQIQREKRINPVAIRTLSSTGRADFKFVVRSLEDVEELETEYGSFIYPEQVWLMAEGSSRQEQLNTMPILSDICKQKGYRLSLRLHILNWDNQRGR